MAWWQTTVSTRAVSGLDATHLASARLHVSPHPTTLVAGNPADVMRDRQVRAPAREFARRGHDATRSDVT